MIRITHLNKTFNIDGGDIQALKDINIQIEDGDIYGIIGMSGAGKSTFVRCINMLERPTSGSVEIDGVNIGELSPKELREYRKSVTMIFQGFNLLMQRNCLKNICFPLENTGMSKSEIKKKARELLEIVGLKDKEKAYPAQLSGGQQQRIAIARALATNPKILLCDEATSALDPTTTNQILDLIRDINKKMGITCIVITHQMSVVEAICNKVSILDNGEIVEEGLTSDIFAHPKSDAAKKLVFPNEGEPLVINKDGKKYIRVVYNGANAAFRPLIAEMAIEKGIKANISYASTKTIGGMAYGSMLLSIDGDEKEIAEAIEYLSVVPNIAVEEVGANV